MERDVEDYIMQLEKRIVFLEGRVAMLEVEKKIYLSKPYEYQSYEGCSVCGRTGMDLRVCNHPNCPSRVTC